MGYVYVIGNTHAEVCKIGFSKTPNKRLKGIQTGCPYPIKILYLFVGSINLEKQLHKKYSKYRLNGEWFSYTGELRAALENSKESIL